MQAWRQGIRVAQTRALVAVKGRPGGSVCSLLIQSLLVAQMEMVKRNGGIINSAHTIPF